MDGMPCIAGGLEGVIGGLVGEKELVEDAEGAAGVSYGGEGHGAGFLLLPFSPFFNFFNFLFGRAGGICIY